MRQINPRTATPHENTKVAAPYLLTPPGPLKKQRFPFQLSPSRRQQNVINLRVIKIFSDKLLGLTNPRRTKLLHGTLLHIGHLSDKTLKKTTCYYIRDLWRRQLDGPFPGSASKHKLTVPDSLVIEFPDSWELAGNTMCPHSLVISTH
jgi:hypothetical protein